MSDFLKCACPHCGQSIEYPAEGTGQTVPCPTCEKSFVLTPANPPNNSDSNEKPIESVKDESRARKAARSKLSQLTAVTIREKTTAGNTPLHLAAKNGHIDLIPSHLLSEELFMDRNRDGNTPLHIAAMHGNLYQVPRRFLTKETLTITTTTYYAPNGFHITGSGYKALCPNVLHIAAISGYVDQIPKEFFTPEFLQIETTGYKNTLLEYLVKSKRLDLLPENYANNELWNAKDRDGHTPLQHLEYLIEREAQRQTWQAERESYVARVRNEPATEKQKEKLRYFGYAFDETITKGQASDALDKCVRDNPEKDSAYYNRPPTEEQLEKIRELNEESVRIDGEERFDLETLTYGKAKDIIQEREMYERKEKEEEFGREILIDMVAFRDWFNEVTIYPGLTRGRVKKAAKVLDENQPGWSNDKNSEEILSKKVAELNPELATREGWPTWPTHSPDVSPESLAEAIKPLENHTKTTFHYPASSGYAVQGQNAPTETQLQKIKELELKLDKQAGITADKLAVFLELHGHPTREEDWSVFRIHGITSFIGDAMASYALSVLIGYFEEIVQAENWKNCDDRRVYRSCQVAMRDPAHGTPSLILDKLNRVTFSWPKRKLKEWYRKGAEF